MSDPKITNVERLHEARKPDPSLLENLTKQQKDLELAKARLQGFMAQIERLKAENLKLKHTIKIMERRIMEGHDV